MNYNTVFCEEVENITDEEMAWILAQVDPKEGDESALDIFIKEHGGLTFTAYREDGKAILEADESVNPEEVAALMIPFLSRFRPDETWTLQYAHTASRSVPGAYGGGGVIVTKDGARYMDSTNFVAGNCDHALTTITAALRHIEQRLGHKFNREDWDIFDGAMKAIEQGW